MITHAQPQQGSIAIGRDALKRCAHTTLNADLDIILSAADGINLAERNIGSYKLAGYLFFGSALSGRVEASGYRRNGDS
jgi:hypothetical protein